MIQITRILLLTLMLFSATATFATLQPLQAQEYKTQDLLENINQWFEDGAIAVIGLSKNPVFIDRNVSLIKEAFQDKMDKNPEIINIFYGAEEGYFRLNSLDSELPSSFNYKARPWYYQARAKRDLIFTQPYIDVNTRDSVITMAIPVKDNSGKIHGVVGADILVNSIVNLLNEKSQEIKELGTQNLIFVMNSQGDELISSFQSVTNGFVKKINGRKLGIFRTENMLTRYVRFFRLNGLPWYLLEFTSSLDSNFLNIYRELNRSLNSSRFQLRSIAQKRVYYSENSKSIKRQLAKDFARFPAVHNLVFGKNSHQSIYFEGRGEPYQRDSYKTTDWFLKGFHTRKTVVSNKTLDQMTRKQIFTFGQPLWKGDKLHGLLAADFEVKPLIDLLKKAQNLCCLMDKEGHIVLSRNSDTMKSLVVDKIAWQKKYRFEEDVVSNGVKSRLEFNRIHLPGWFLILQEFGQ